jgi:hypothetical protein
MDVSWLVILWLASMIALPAICVAISNTVAVHRLRKLSTPTMINLPWPIPKAIARKVRR